MDEIKQKGEKSSYENGKSRDKITYFRWLEEKRINWIIVSNGKIIKVRRKSITGSHCCPVYCNNHLTSLLKEKVHVQ